MHSSLVLPVLIASLGLAACSQSASSGGDAKEKPAAAASSSATEQSRNGLSGSPVAGVCLLSRQAVFTNTMAGKAASERLQQLAQDVQHGLDAERAPFEAAVKQLRVDAPHLKDTERQRREQELTRQMRKVELDGELRRRELDATRLKATEQLAQVAQPLIVQAYKAHQCGLLLDGNVVLGGNTSNDLTAEVVRTLDEKVQTISFELAKLPAPSSATTP